MMVFTRASSHYILLPSSTLLRNVSGACICGWVYHLSSSPFLNGDRMFDVGTSGAADDTRFCLGIQDSGVSYVAARTLAADAITVRNDTTVLSNNTLYHIAANVDFVNQLIYFYVNGAFSSTPSAGTWTAGNTENINCLSSAIGSSPAGARFWMDGRLDDVRCYGRMLSAGEISTVYSCRGVDGIYYGLQARFLLNEKHTGYSCVGTEKILNMVDNSINGTPTAGIVYTDSALKWRGRSF